MGRLETLRRVEPSEEIRRVLDRWMVAISEGDIQSALARLSDDPDALTLERHSRTPAQRAALSFEVETL